MRDHGEVAVINTALGNITLAQGGNNSPVSPVLPEGWFPMLDIEALPEFTGRKMGGFDFLSRSALFAPIDDGLMDTLIMLEKHWDRWREYSAPRCASVQKVIVNGTIFTCLDWCWQRDETIHYLILAGFENLDSEASERHMGRESDAKAARLSDSMFLLRNYY